MADVPPPIVVLEDVPMVDVMTIATHAAPPPPSPAVDAQSLRSGPVLVCLHPDLVCLWYTDWADVCRRRLDIRDLLPPGPLSGEEVGLEDL